MNRSKKAIIAGAIALGMGSGAVLFTPGGSNAAGNVVLASVDWVTSQLNPMKTKITALETKIASQQQQINNLQTQINNLPTTSATPATPATPTTTTTPAQMPSVVYTVKASAPIRSGASTGYKIIATKPAGTALKVIDSIKLSSGLWYRVELSSTVKGWIFSSDVSVTKPASATPTQVITKSSVNIRSGATGTYRIVATVNSGVTLKYVGSIVNSKGEKWYNVITPTGVKGWMLSTLGEVR